MNIEEINQARKNYKQKLKEKEELLELKKELEELSKNPNVKRYIELSNLANVDISSEEEMIKHSFNRVNKTKTDLVFYLYMGAYEYSGRYLDSDDYAFNINEADYLIYQNLEKETDQVLLRPDRKEKFEEENIVLKCPVLQAGRKYYELQNILYKELLTSDLDKGKILEKLKQHLL